MMRIRCPKCESQLRVDDSKSGSTVGCPRCKAKLKVPAKKTEAAPPPPPEPDLEPQLEAQDLWPTDPEPEEPRFRREKEAPSQIEVEPYEAARFWNPIKVLLLIAIMALTAVGLGWLTSWIGQWFYLLIFFPILMAFGLGIVGVVVITASKLCHAPLSAWIGLGIGLLAVGSMHWFDYQRFLEEIPKLLPGQKIAMPSFGDYLSAQSEAGVKIRSITISGIFLWLIWIVELVIVMGGTAFMMWYGGSEPFCVECANWKEETEMGTFEVPRERSSDETSEQVDEAFREGRIGDIAWSEYEEGPVVKFTLVSYICEQCEDAPVVVELKRTEVDKEGEVEQTELSRINCHPKDVDYFQRMCRREEE